MYCIVLYIVCIPGTWTWTDGTPWCFENWADYQPDNKHGGEDYVVFNPCRDSLNGIKCDARGKWNDDDDVVSEKANKTRKYWFGMMDILGFICQK